MNTNNFIDLQNHFSDFYESVKLIRQTEHGIDHYGHGLDHDITVSTLAMKIATDEHTGCKAWCAGLLHSFDRIIGDDKAREAMELQAKYLTHYFSQEEIGEIIEAAYRHTELNQEDQSSTQITLMDADRLANLQSAVIIRAGQFRPDIPALDFNYLSGNKDPLSTYDHPKTILDNLRFIITNYIPQLRLPIAKELGDIYANRLNLYIKSIEYDYEYLDLKNITI